MFKKDYKINIILLVSIFMNISFCYAWNLDILRLPMGDMSRIKKAMAESMHEAIVLKNKSLKNKPSPKIEIVSIAKIPYYAGNITICLAKVDGKEYEISGIGVKKIESDITELLDNSEEYIRIVETINKVEPSLGEAAEKEKWTWWRPTQTLNITNPNVINSGL